MKGIVLAGGLGTRLRPLTNFTNKHLLLVHDRPMIAYPLETLRRAGIDEVTIVTGGPFAAEFPRLLGSGGAFGLRLSYTHQDGEGGIADALRRCERFAAGENICVMLGDNLLEDDIAPYAKSFAAQASGARLLLKPVPDPHRFGVAEVQHGRIVSIEEKPVRPKSDLAVTGIYFYDAQVFAHIRALQPSHRCELEITDVNLAYLRAGNLRYDVLSGWWADAGEFESLRHAATLVARGRQDRSLSKL